MIVMKIIELQGKLPEEVIESFKKRGIAELTPPQALAVEYGLLEGRDFVVAAPTASGKTLIAEMAMLRSVMRGRKKAIYVAPMRALVSEKYHEFKEAYPEIKVAMSIGDLDSLDSWLHEYQIVLASTEKLDSLIRHGAEWLDSVGCIVFDEVHMLDDSTRGPTLEILMTRLKRIAKDSQIIALSATVGNAKELAEWLGSELIESRQFFISSNRGNLTQSKGLLCPGSSVVERLFCKQDVGGSIPSQGSLFILKVFHKKYLLEPCHSEIILCSPILIESIKKTRG